MTFEELVKSRHSAVNFKEDFVMTEDDFRKIMELTKLAPSPFNFQPTRYLVITDKELKEKVRAFSYHQHKIHTASALVLVIGDERSFDESEAERMMSPMRMLGILDDTTYQSLLMQAKGYGDALRSNPKQMITDLKVSSAISASFFMLSAKNLGFDTCPVHIQDEQAIKDLLGIPDHCHIDCTITIGRSVDKTRPRGYRKSFSEQVSFNKF